MADEVTQEAAPEAAPEQDISASLPDSAYDEVQESSPAETADEILGTEPAEEAAPAEAQEADPLTEFEQAEIAAGIVPQAAAPQAQAQPTQQLDPRIVQMLEAQQQQTRFFTEALQNQYNQQKAQQLMARAPQPPDPATATVNDMLKYAESAAAFQTQVVQERLQSGFKSQMESVEKRLIEAEQKLARAEAAAQFQAREMKLNSAVAAAAAKPGMQWLKDPGKAAMLKFVYQQTSQNGYTLSQTAELLAQEFGLGKPTPQMQSQAVRKASTSGLQAARAKAATAKVVPAAGGKAKVGGKQTPVERIASLQKDTGIGLDDLPADLREYYRLKSGLA